MVSCSRFLYAFIAVMLCLAATPLWAQSQSSPSAMLSTGSPHGTPLPQQLMLQAAPGAASGTYQDEAGQLYNVTPQDTGGTQCDPQGCMVQVCHGGACSYYYCRVSGGCRQVSVPSGAEWMRRQSGVAEHIA